MIEETAEQRLARYERVIEAQMQEITKLRAQVAGLTEGATAISTLQSKVENRTERRKSEDGLMDPEDY
jgi:hypothetical protein